MIATDNGTECTSNAFLGWADETGVDWNCFAPGKPQQNGHNERLASPPFGSRVGYATSCWTRNFCTLPHARAVLEA
jgi:putative transposase